MSTLLYPGVDEPPRQTQQTHPTDPSTTKDITYLLSTYSNLRAQLLQTYPSVFKTSISGQNTPNFPDAARAPFTAVKTARSQYPSLLEDGAGGYLLEARAIARRADRRMSVGAQEALVLRIVRCLVP